MYRRCLRVCCWFLVWLFLLQARVEAGGNGIPVSSEQLTARGTLVCLSDELKEKRCDGRKGGLFGLKTVDSQVYPLKAGKAADTLYEEKRLLTKEFQLTLKRSGTSPFYEIVKSQFIREGKLYDFYYFCDVCNITTYSPGYCMCCQQETQYREKSAE